MNSPLQVAETHRKRAGVGRMVKHNLKIDMTPMVDLGFLLISFFVITTELSKPSAMSLIMPKDSTLQPTELAESKAMTVLLSNKTAFYYFGKWEDAIKSGSIYTVSFYGKEGLRKTIQDKQLWLDRTDKEEGRSGLMLLIKADASAQYKRLVNVLDEIAITEVKKYAVVGISEEEREWMSKNK
jgi:biopolymer transport protein ExbD